jgi:hypothetical protein
MGATQTQHSVQNRKKIAMFENPTRDGTNERKVSFLLWLTSDMSAKGLWLFRVPFLLSLGI